jgi:hypothetical protein
MPEVICTTVYQFPELSDGAQDKARSWYRELGVHDDWWDAVYDDFERVENGNAKVSHGSGVIISLRAA